MGIFFRGKDFCSNLSESAEHNSRINNVLDIKEYLLRKHDVLHRPDTKYKENEFISAKIVLNTIKTILDAHISYVVGNPISLGGEQNIVTEYNKVYRKGGYELTDYEITSDLYKYGNAFEYVYLDDNEIIRSKVIANEDSYPVYDDEGRYTHFIEHWKDINRHGVNRGDGYYIVYYPDSVEKYENGKLLSTSQNLTGLPIHYSSLDRSAYNHFGDSMVNDLIPIMDRIEYLLSKMDDAITTLSMNPIGVIAGQRLDSAIPKDMIGAVLMLDDGSNFKWESTNLDYNNIKLEIDTLTQQLYAVAGVPSTIMGQSNVANVSETSLKMLYSLMDDKAKKSIHVLMTGFYKRFEYIRKLFKLLNVEFTDEEFYSLEPNFNINRPVDTGSLMNELKTQCEMGAISVQTIIDKSPYTTNTALELQRLQNESNINENKKEE